MNDKKTSLAALFITFAKVGVMTFGGGYAMIPILDRELCENKGWVTQEELMDYYAIGQCTPGIIAVNTASFVGHKLYGITGAIVATLGVVFPSIVIITLIAALLKNFADLEIVKHAFAGIRVCVCVLILNAVIKLFKSGIKDVYCVVLFLLIFALSFFLDISPIIFVLFSAAAGIALVKSGVNKK